MIAVILFILMFVFAIILHEFGHYLAARHYGVISQEFNIGFGPKICGFKKFGTEWNIRALPLGGSCVFGENDEKLSTLKTSQRIVVLAAGVTVNLSLALLSLFAASLLQEAPLTYFTTYLMNMLSAIPSFFYAFIEALSPEYGTLAETGSLIAQQAASYTTIQTAAYLFSLNYSVNFLLFFFNILPIPALDGGQIMLAIPELFHRPLKEKTVNVLNTTFYYLIFGYSILFLIKDVICTIW